MRTPILTGYNFLDGNFDTSGLTRSEDSRVGRSGPCSLDESRDRDHRHA
jgi:hypothetical protein